MIRIVVLLLLAPLHLSGQKNDSGIIFPHDSSHSSNTYYSFYIPEQGLNIYRTSGELQGRIEFAKGKEGKIDPYSLLLISSEKDTSSFSYTHFIEVGYEIMALSFNERKNGRVKIEKEGPAFWLKVEELENSGFITQNWQDYMTSKSGEVLGFYVEEAMKVRSTASAQGEKLATLTDDLFQISLTGEHKGKWSKVKVIKYKEHPCEGGGADTPVELELEGWMKVINEEGKPNIWYATRGC